MDMVCSDCRKETEVVFDHARGDTVCSECGLVLESHSIQDSSEWRTFTDENNKADPNRVGLQSNPLLDEHVLTTIITNPNGTKSNNVINQRVTAVKNTGQHLEMVFERIRAIAYRLELVSTIVNRGCVVYKKVYVDDNTKTCRARNLDAVLCACLLYACEQEKLPRTVKEMLTAVKDGNSTKKDVMKAKNYIKKKLGEEKNEEENFTTTIRASDLIKRFCSNLGIGDTFTMKAAVEATYKCEEEVDVRRSPISVAAALIYIIVQLQQKDSGFSLKDIAFVTNVAEGTIRNTYKDLYPDIIKIIPSWFANENAIKTLLCAP